MAVKQEIKVGLENAINRGESLQKAMQSFVNAGYNIKDINYAATEVQKTLGTTGQTSQNNSINQNQSKIQNSTTEVSQQIQPLTTKKKLPWKIIIISTILLALLGILAFILFRL